MTSSPSAVGSRPALQGGVIAAGDGSRLRAAGLGVPKPLVTVGGVALLEAVARNFAAAGVTPVTVIVNEAIGPRCVDWARGRFAHPELRFIVKTTASSLESFLEVTGGPEPGPMLVSTVDAWCAATDFVRFVGAARRRPADALVLGVTPLVADEKPLWVDVDATGHVTALGGPTGSMVTAGLYLVPEPLRRQRPPPGLGRLRDYLAWLHRSGWPVHGEVIDRVVDVDRAEDIAQAERLALGSVPVTRAAEAHGVLCWGIFREPAHSPGRESDDALILRATAKRLEDRGFRVELRDPDELDVPGDRRPRGVFLMCERLPVLKELLTWETQGVRQVNRPAGVLNTYRERMIAGLAAADVPFIDSRVVATDARDVPGALPVWVKRADVHNTQEGDVVLAPTPAALAAALAGLAARGLGRAVLQPHVEGDLVKFYGIGTEDGPDGGPQWFRWFYHADQQLHAYPFDTGRVARLVRRAAVALGLEVYGGDAIVTPAGEPVLLDLNAWPSFARVRDAAADAIAEHLAIRFAGEAR